MAESKGITTVASVALALVALGIVLLILATSGTQPECAQGLLLEKGRLLDGAAAAYARARGEQMACGTPGGVRIAHRQKEAAQEFESAGVLASSHPSIAINYYIEGLSEDPFDKGAAGKLNHLLKESETPKPGPKTEAGASTETRAKVEAKGRVFCRRANELTEAGLLSEARSTLAFGLTKSPGPPCPSAIKRLKRRRVRAATRLHRAEAQAEGGSAGIERTAYAQALHADPALSAARSGLKGSLDRESNLDSVATWLSGTAPAMQDALAWLVPLAIGLLIAAALVWNALRSASTESARVRSVTKKLRRAPLLGLPMRAAAPTVAVADFSGGSESKLQGKDFAALIAERLPRPAGRAPDFPFDRTSKGSKEDQTAANIASILDAVPQAKALGAVVKLIPPLFRRRRLEVAGHLAPSGDRGAGVTVTLGESSAPDQTSVTIWENLVNPVLTGDGAAPWLRLVAPAAVWARWRLAAIAKPEANINVGAWEADALFQAGVDWQNKGEWGRAEPLYVTALERDPELLPAAHNLAVIEMRCGMYPQAIRRLEQLRKKLEDDDRTKKGDEKPSELWPALKTSLIYSLALAKAYRAGV